MGFPDGKWVRKMQPFRCQLIVGRVRNMLFRRTVVVSVTLVVVLASILAVAPRNARGDPDLISYWRLDEGMGSTAADETLGGHDLSLNNLAIWDVGKISNGLRRGPHGLAASAGSTPFTDFPTAASFTVEAWVKPTAPGAQNLLLLNKWGERPSGGDDCGYNGNGWILGIGPTPAWSSNLRPWFHVKNTAKVGPSATSPSNLAVDAWSHLAGVRDVTAGTIGLYVNGLLMASASDPGGSIVTIRPFSIFGLTCGAAGWASWSGTIVDEIAVYDVARSSEDIERDYQRGLAGHSVMEVPVDIDIKPGSYPNSVNCKSGGGNVPVGIFSDGTFDARLVDPYTLKLEGFLVAEEHGRVHAQDLDGDGDLDVVVHLDRENVCEATLGLPLKEDVSVDLTGETTDGLEFKGTDTIRVVAR